MWNKDVKVWMVGKSSELSLINEKVTTKGVEITSKRNRFDVCMRTQ